MEILQGISNLLNRFTVPIGTWFGVPTFLHWSWTAVLLVLLVMQPMLAQIYVAVFFLVLLHEYGHCVAGKYYQCRVDYVVLYPIGGIAGMVMPTAPSKEIVVALAGPAVNLLLVPVFLLVQYFWPFVRPIAMANLVLLVFNLLPVFPMDGGRIVRAGLTLVLKNYVKATTIAARLGQVLAVGFLVLGTLFGQVSLTLIAIFVLVSAEQELRHVKQAAGETDARLDESSQIVREMLEREALLREKYRDIQS